MGWLVSGEVMFTAGRAAAVVTLRLAWLVAPVLSVTTAVTRRVPAVEILINTPTVRKLLEKNKLDVLPAAIETGNDDGMQTFNQALYKLVKAKLISEEEALLKATNPEALKMNFRGIFLDESRRILANS